MTHGHPRRVVAGFAVEKTFDTRNEFAHHLWGRDEKDGTIYLVKTSARYTVQADTKPIKIESVKTAAFDIYMAGINLLGGVMLQASAVRADRAIGPTRCFKPSASGFLIVKVGGCERVAFGHRSLSLASNLGIAVCGVNYVIGKKFLDGRALVWHRLGTVEDLRLTRGRRGQFRAARRSQNHLGRRWCFEAPLRGAPQHEGC